MTMDRVFLYGVSGLMAGGLSMALAFRRKRALRDLEFGRAVTCFLAAPGVVAAVGIIGEGLTPSKELQAVANAADVRLYLVLGGFSLAYVSLATVGRELRRAMKGDEDVDRPPTQRG